MKVTINEKEFELDDCTTLEEALQQANVRTQGIATALNNKVIPAASRVKTVLKEGDSVTVITAFYGG